jgi:hypothetical protein
MNEQQSQWGKLAVTGLLYWLGWASTIAMAFCIVRMVAMMFMGSLAREMFSPRL